MGVSQELVGVLAREVRDGTVTGTFFRPHQRRELLQFVLVEELQDRVRGHGVESVPSDVEITLLDQEDNGGSAPRLCDPPEHLVHILFLAIRVGHHHCPLLLQFLQVSVQTVISLVALISAGVHE